MDWRKCIILQVLQFHVSVDESIKISIYQILTMIIEKRSCNTDAFLYSRHISCCACVIDQITSNKEELKIFRSILGGMKMAPQWHILQTPNYVSFNLFSIKIFYK